MLGVTGVEAAKTVSGVRKARCYLYRIEHFPISKKLSYLPPLGGALPQFKADDVLFRGGFVSNGNFRRHAP